MNSCTASHISACTSPPRMDAVSENATDLRRSPSACKSRSQYARQKLWRPGGY